MEKDNEKAELKMEVIQSFFENEYSPKEFLDNIHNVIVGMIVLAGQTGSNADIKELAKHTEFLSIVYDTVRRAAI